MVAHQAVRQNLPVMFLRDLIDELEKASAVGMGQVDPLLVVSACNDVVVPSSLVTGLVCGHRRTVRRVTRYRGAALRIRCDRATLPLQRLPPRVSVSAE